MHRLWQYRGLRTARWKRCVPRVVSTTPQKLDGRLIEDRESRIVSNIIVRSSILNPQSSSYGLVIFTSSIAAACADGPVHIQPSSGDSPACQRTDRVDIIHEVRFQLGGAQ